MRLIGIILAACLALAILKAAIAALLLTCVIGILGGLIWRPKETLGLITLLIVGGIAQAHGAAVVGLVGLLTLCSALRR